MTNWNTIGIYAMQKHTDLMRQCKKKKFECEQNEEKNQNKLTKKIKYTENTKKNNVITEFMSLF